ncbi:origin recognition complex subunit 4 isoform X1, putative [Babesia ovata]|uniref:Origin recognition complex subunit 4 isoform X1, putative n=1 Tax=Babesia ovata TaxID=189622 RepID=A0A2H6K7W0_9APIC|nr:origin recognition complex subunit 4 isoform X1, putative [Babesia ovata]GBE59075.1 origin recognition complex subunit 4 isoform X1, putative [Babesia ovata]
MVAVRLGKAMNKAESAIVMVVGPPGSGKTYLVNAAVEMLIENDTEDMPYPPDLESEEEGLRGERIQDIPSDAGSVSDMPWTVRLVLLEAYNYRDEMKCLKHLALLIEKIAGVNTSRCGKPRLLEVQQRVIRCLKQLRKAHIFVVIVIEGVDVFTKGKNDCSVKTGTCYRRQGLLYFLGSLLDSEELAFAMVGITPDIRTVDRLEKRVRSRFMHYTVYCDRSNDYDEVMAPGRLSLLGDRAVLTLDSESKQYLGENMLCGGSATSAIAAACAQLPDDAFTKQEDGQLCISAEAVSAVFRDSGNTRWFEEIVWQLSVADHYVLVALARLHALGIVPVTLMDVERDLKDLAAYYPSEKEAIPRFQGLARVFINLVAMGVVDWVRLGVNRWGFADSGAGICDPQGANAPCRFTYYKTPQISQARPQQVVAHTSCGLAVLGDADTQVTFVGRRRERYTGHKTHLPEECPQTATKGIALFYRNF